MHRQLTNFVDLQQSSTILTAHEPFINVTLEHVLFSAPAVFILRVAAMRSPRLCCNAYWHQGNLEIDLSVQSRVMYTHLERDIIFKEMQPIETHVRFRHAWFYITRRHHMRTFPISARLLRATCAGTVCTQNKQKVREYHHAMLSDVSCKCECHGLCRHCAVTNV